MEAASWIQKFILTSFKLPRSKADERVKELTKMFGLESHSYR